MNWVTELILNFIYDLMASFLNIFGYMINDVYAVMLEINSTQEVTALTALTSALGIAMVAFMVIKQILGTYGLETEGDSERDPLNVLYRVGKCIAIIACNGWLFNEIIALAQAVGRDINKSLNLVDANSTLINLLNNAIEGGPSIVICIGIIVIGFALFTVAAGIRGAELTLSKILLPIFAVDIINSSPEKWNMFFFQYVINFFSYLVQFTCFRIMIIYLARINIGDTSEFVKNFVLTIGWLILSIKTPQILEKYTYATGTGRVVSNGASRLGQVLMYTVMKR